MADLILYRGDVSTLTITVQKADGSGVENITGFTLFFVAKRSALDADADAVIRKDNASGGQGGIALTSPTLGIATVTISASTTSGQPPVDQVLLYEIQSVDTAGNPETLARGTLHLLADLQRSTS